MKTIPILFFLGNLAFQRAQNWLLAVNRVKHNTPVSNSGVGFISSSLLTVLWNDYHIPVWNMQKFVETVLIPWSLLCQQEQNGQHDNVWSAEVTGSGWCCMKSRHCSVVNWLVEGQRERRREETPPKGHSIHASAAEHTYSTQDARLAAW